MNRDKFREAIPVHERLVEKENEIAELQNTREKLNKELGEVNKKIELANKERLAIYEEFKVI